MRLLPAVFLSLGNISFSQDSDNQDLAAKNGIRSAFVATEVKIDVEPSKKEFVAEWKYTNPYEQPLAIDAISSSCGCLAAPKVEFKPIAKGESSSISATFTPGNHRGILRKSLYVTFAMYEKPIELVVEAHIPSPVELSTQELSWTKENKNQPQIVDVTSGTAQDFEITGLLGVPESLFSVVKETVTEKRHYRLRITPTGEPVQNIQVLQVRTDSKDPRDQVIAVFLRVPQA